MAFGQVFVGALLQVLFQMLASDGLAQVVKFVMGKKIDPRTIKNFEESLRMIAALLVDAQERRIESAAFKIWVEELQDLAYDLDDVLDELSTDAQLQLQRQGEDDDEDYGSMARSVTCLQSAKTKVKSILSCGSRVVQSLHYLGGDLPSMIEEINNRLQQIYKHGQTLGLADHIIKPDMQYAMEGAKQILGRETTSFVDELRVFGREEEKRDVIRELLKEESGNRNYVVIPIVGNGGIGKTTLAQCVYNDQQLKGHFDIKAWVYVSDVFNVKGVITDIINVSISSINTSLQFSNLNQAQYELIEVLRDKRFLIVLDDIWIKNYNDWIHLLKPFQYGARGSKVIVTTRDESIAKMVITNPNHPIVNLEGLLNEDCWHLFLQHVNEDSNDLVEMKNDIINKCKGLPLAAKALGGLFRKTRKSDRQMILDNDIWTEESNVLPVLRLSYYNLPPHLKHIFAFCCILPKDYEFGEMEVILLWMAQGLLIEKLEGEFEDIGHLYFHDLVSRSLFEPSPSNEKCYNMHNLVHDLAQWAAGNICHCAGNVPRILERTRHLYINSSGTDHALRVIDKPVAAKLRTLICPAKEHIDGLNVGLHDLITRFRSIRILFLASNTVAELPACIGDLKHLRFLDLRFTKIQVFPNSIRKLCNLQVLFLDGCCNLREVTNIRFLVKLRHLRFHQMLWESMPWGIRNLTSLQSLGSINLGVDNRNGSMIRELGSLNHLHGELSIRGLENVKKVDDAQEAQLHEKKGLTKMYMEWGRDRDEIDDKIERDVLEELKPSTCMEKLKLKGYMGMTLPTWFGDASFKNMVSIKLMECKKCKCLPPFGQLPSLKKLVILGCDYLISICEIPSSLVQLEIKECRNLEKVEFKKSLPSLSTSCAPNNVTITIWYCDSLVTLGRIPLTVKRLRIFKCKKVKYLLFSEMTLESKEEEEEEDTAGVRQEESDGVGSSMEVSEKKVQTDSPIELVHLLQLSIHECSSFISLPEDLYLPSIQTIEFYENEKQEALPEQMHTFTSLERLIIKCPEIRCFPKGGLPKTGTLKSVGVHGVNIEQPPIGEWGFDLLTHLDYLAILYTRSSSDLVECIPGPHLNLPSSLSVLKISAFINLKSIHCASFPNLTQLWIDKCPKLENLGDYNSSPPNLNYVYIGNCPIIQQQCQPDTNGLISFDIFGKHRYRIKGQKGV